MIKKGVIADAGLNEDKKWNDDDYKLFNSNIDKIPGCRIDGEHFDMWKYASFYCQQDVNILRLGFMNSGMVLLKTSILTRLNSFPFHHSPMRYLISVYIILMATFIKLVVMLVNSALMLFMAEDV